MAKINEQQIIDFYSNRKQELQKELTKIENVLSTLQETEKPKRRYTRRTNGSEPVATAGRGKSTQGTKKQPKQKSVKTAASALLPPLDDRLMQVLSEIGPASKAAVTQEMTARYPQEAPQKISRGAALRLSMMAKSGKIQTKGQGDQVVFFV